MKNKEIKIIKLHCGACDTWNHFPVDGDHKCNVCEALLTSPPKTAEEVAASKAIAKVARKIKKEEFDKVKEEGAEKRREMAAKRK